MFDYHVHTEFSVDCMTPMRASCDAAIAAGVTEIAFTDHVDHEPLDPGRGYYLPEAYFRMLNEVRKEYEGRLVVLAGAEVDFNERTMPLVDFFMQEWGPQYDFVIGSVHYGLEGQIIVAEYFQDRSIDEVYQAYFRELNLAASTGWFDTLGHLDLPKRYAPRSHRVYDPLAYKPDLDRLFSTMAAQDMAFEINTSGIRQGPKASMPGPAIVRWYVEAGGTKITTGTDSHLAKNVGAGLPETLDMLRLCGITDVASFRNRQSTPRPIETLRPTSSIA